MNEDFMQYDGLICKVAKKFYNLDFNDLKQAGYLGLVKAYKNFNPSSGAKFSTYAYEYIFGEMYELALKTNSVKINKGAFKIYKELIKARDLLTQKYARSVSIYEVVKYLNLDYNEVVDILNSISVSSDIEDNYNNYFARDKIDELILLRESFNELTSEERDIIKSRYFDDFTQEETAKKLGLSQVKVSRLEKRSKEKIREFITS